MNDFIITVMTAGVASGVIGLLFEDDNEINKYIRLVLSLCFLCAVIPGGVKLFSHFAQEAKIELSDEFIDIENCAVLYEDSVIEEARTNLESELCQKIFENTGIMVENVSIQFNVTRTEDLTDVDIGHISVIVNDSESGKKVSDFIKELLLKEPETVIKNNGVKS